MHPFQKEAFYAYADGYSGLINAPTGSGKTFSLAIPSILNYNQEKGVFLLWITPLRSLASEIQEAIATAAAQMEIAWQVGIRNGDTSPAERERQNRNMPQCLVITPESLHVLFTKKNYEQFFKQTNAVVVDEWHELLGSKRGVQTELAISRLKAINPKVKVWGISATIGNLQQAMEVLIPHNMKRVLIKSNIEKPIEVETILPDEIEKFPWAGHLGIRLLHKVLPVIDSARTTLIFTNTRSQSELWYQYLLDANPALGGLIAMHHGSLDYDIRLWVEQAIENGYLKAVVCTSSLDLGVDFKPVDTVIQIGSPKGVARFVQRAGRSNHSPGLPSKIYFLPTHALELIEAAALKEAIARKIVEERIPVVRAFDVLVQYAVTLAVGNGFNEKQLYDEVKTTHAYNTLDKEEWQKLLHFVVTGGPSLASYNEYRKVEKAENIYRVTNRKIAMQHRLSIGTIEFDSSLSVAYLNGKRVGSIEEYFISRLENGDNFMYAGKRLELVKVEGMTAYVKPATTNKKAAVPSWMGGRMSLTSEISDLLRKQLNKPWYNKDNTELNKLTPILQLQSERSVLPRASQLLIEQIETDEGYHVFIFPFEGRLIHEGMSMLLSYRWALKHASTISLAYNDYGFEMLSDQPIDMEEMLQSECFSTDNLEEHLYKSTNYTEIARRRFSNIAAIAGLLFKGYPQKVIKSRHLQASASLFFQVFKDYDNTNLLYRQAYEEALYNQLDAVRLRRALKRIQGQEIVLKYPEKISPFAFPILVDRLREQMSTEKLESRIRRLIAAQQQS